MSFLFFDSLSCHLPILCSCILQLFPATHYFGLKLLPSFLRYPSHLYCHSSLNVWTGESESCSVVSDSLWPHGLYSPWNSPGQNTGVGSLSLLQGIFPTQGTTQVSCIAGGFFTSWARRNVCEVENFMVTLTRPAIGELGQRSRYSLKLLTPSFPWNLIS